MYKSFNAHAAPYTAKCLLPTDQDLLAFLGLQSVAKLTATSGTGHYLKERTIADLKAHIDARMPIIAVHSARGEYVAHALLAYPIHDDVVQHMTQYPFNGTEATTAVIQSLYVMPKHRGKNLDETIKHKKMDPASLIFDTAKDLAAMHGHTRIMAKVACDNTGSLKTFEKSGFSIQETHFDATGGYMAHYLACPLYAAPCLAPAAKNAVLFGKDLSPAA